MLQENQRQSQKEGLRVVNGVRGWHGKQGVDLCSWCRWGLRGCFKEGESSSAGCLGEAPSKRKEPLTDWKAGQLAKAGWAQSRGDRSWLWAQLLSQVPEVQPHAMAEFFTFHPTPLSSLDHLIFPNTQQLCVRSFGSLPNHPPTHHQPLSRHPCFPLCRRNSPDFLLPVPWERGWDLLTSGCSALSWKTSTLQKWVLQR